MSNDRAIMGDEEWLYRERECERAECEDARANLAAQSRTTGNEAWLAAQWAALSELAKEHGSDLYRTTCRHGFEFFNTGQAPYRPSPCTRCMLADAVA